MNDRRRRHTRTALRTAAFALLVTPPAALLGCSQPTAPVIPPTGGQTLVLSFDEFAASVEPVLSAKGCDAGGDCHGGGIRGTFELSPAGAKDVHFDFVQASLQVSPAIRDSSRILTKPLALDAGGVPHSVKVFATTSDSGYQAIHHWILDGVLQ